MKRRNMAVDPLHGNVVMGMLLFALPIMGTVFLQMLFTSVDTMVVGRYGSDNAMAAVGACSAIISLIVSAVSGLGTGISILAGQRTGRGDREGVSKLLHSIPLTALCIGGAAAAAVIPGASFLLERMHCPQSLLPRAAQYFGIYLLSLPFMVCFQFLSAVSNAEGNSFLPFVIEAACGLLNLGLNLLFVIAFRWDVAGVAVATVLSQVCGASAVFCYFAFFQKRVQIRRLRLFTGFGEVFRIGLPSSLESVVMNLSGVVMQSAINGFPESVISGNAVASSIEGLICVSFVGFSSAATVFISQNYAAGDIVRTRKIQRGVTLCVLALGELLGLALYAAADLLTALYTADPMIAQAARVRMAFMCLPYGLLAAMNVSGGCVLGLGDTKIPLAISVACSCLFRIVWIYAYAIPRGTVEAIYISYPICWLLATLLYVVAFFGLLRKNALRSVGCGTGQRAL